MQLVSSGLTYGQTGTRVSLGRIIRIDESVSLREMLLQAIDVRGEKPGFPPGLGRVLAERLG